MNRDKAELIPKSSQSIDTTREPQSLSVLQPLLPWLRLMPPLQLEYQLIEIRLSGDQAQVRGERGTLRNGEITREIVDATLPAALYIEAAEELQRQTQAMLQAMLMPWTALMLPFFQTR